MKHPHRPDSSPSACPRFGRRTLFRASVAGAVGGLLLPAGLRAEEAARPAEEPSGKSPPVPAPEKRKEGYPGPFPGRVVEVHHPGSLRARKVVREAVREMVDRGMTELTGAPDPVLAWRALFEPGDVVGIKVNPVGAPYAISSHELVHEVADGLAKAGVARKDIVVFDRYRAQFIGADYVKNLPDGCRWDASVEDYDDVQLDIEGYDPEVFREIDLVSRGRHDPKDPRAKRSHLSLIVSKKVSKIVNLPVLKDHASAGVTLALKNMSHGFVNNVARSHASWTTNACNTFIPAIVSMPEIRSKVVLHILDGLRGVFDGGPSSRIGTVWEHHTLFFATDPVAMDRIGWEVVDGKRRSIGLPPVAESRFHPPKDDAERRTHSFRQPEHIELAAALGLGVFDRERIELKRAALGEG